MSAGRWHVAAGLFYALGTVLVTFPLITRLTTDLGGSNGDIFLFTWDGWWLSRVVAGGLDPLWTPYLYFPDGASLAFHTLAAPLTAWSIVALPHVGIVTLYNVALLAALFASALSAYALAFYVTRSIGGALLAGIIFGFCANRLDQARAHPDIVAGLWLPLMVLAALVLLDSPPGRKRVAAVVAAAVAGVLGLLTRPEHTIAGFYLIALLYLAFVLRRRTRWRRALASYAAVVLCTAAVGSPYLLRVLRAGPVPLTRSYDDEQVAKGVSLDRLVLPPRDSVLWGWWSSALAINRDAAPPGKIGFVGYVTLALLLLGCVVARGSPAWWTWLAAALFFFLVSFGAELLIQEKSTGFPLVYRLLPDVGAMRAPNRFVPAAMLCLAMAVAIAWSCALQASSRPRVAAVLTFLLGGVLLLEYALLPFPTVRPRVSPFYERLAADPQPFGIVEIPRDSRRHDKIYMYYQTIHGKPLHSGHVSRVPEGTTAFLRSIPLLRALDRQHDAAEALAVDVPGDLQRLRRHNFRYVIFHKLFGVPMFDGCTESEAAIAAEIARVTGPPAYEDDLLLAFDLRGASSRDHSSAASR